ncbi:HD-GYP domain-containing protein [Deinococcus ruber]|uniref:HD-GYP domain-containing protein n=1 Tax=Deinococcus ruber TaxID=1848197 RepID=UPI0016632FC7|nr:HD-GYP domain-containing protein [Deinococcus ruber]
MMSPVRRLRQLLILAATPVLLALGLILRPSLNRELELFSFHSVLVGTLALLALLLTVAIGTVGIRQRNGHVLLLSLASASLVMVYAVHGLASPEVGVPGIAPLQGMPDMPGMEAGYSVSLPIAAQLGALLTALWLALSTVPSDHPLLRRLFRLPGMLLALWLLGLGGLAALLLLVPQRAAQLFALPGIQVLLTLAAVLLCAAAAWRSWQSWRYSNFPLQLAVVYAALWLAGAQIILSVGSAWTVSWWIYHVLLVGVTAAISVGLIWQSQRPDVPLGTALMGLWNNRPDDLLAAGISRGVQTLVLSTEAHDPYTAGHSYRVALHALRLARACGLSPEALRAITQGGILHDLGKLDMPGSVLNSPGKLSAQEWTLMQQHPVLGYERCRALGFHAEELGVVRSHHERWDGTGYPDQLAGEAIPFLARLLSIADVYDALTSERSYRDAWSHERANAHIHEQAGVMFDPALVIVWLQLPPLDLALEPPPTWQFPFRSLRPAAPA